MSRPVRVAGRRPLVRRRAHLRRWLVAYGLPDWQIRYFLALATARTPRAPAARPDLVWWLRPATDRRER